MAKNMYQKRRERQANRNDTQDINTNKTNINWDNPTNRQLRSNLYKISISLN